MNEYSDITSLKGVGDKLALKFHKLGIFTLWDLITYYPRDYEEEGKLSLVADCEKFLTNDEKIAVKLKIVSSCSVRHVKKLSILSVIGVDEIGDKIELSFINMPYLKNTLHMGVEYIFKGLVKKRGASYYISQPAIIKEEDYKSIEGTIQPVYSLTKGITSKIIKKYVRLALDSIDKFEDYLICDKDIVSNGFIDFMEMNDAIYNMHFPKSKDLLLKARKRLVFDEFFFFLMNVRMLKDDSIRRQNDCPMIEVAETDRIIKRLPYSLTTAQLRTFKEIISDLASEHTMNRLVQGDVGSGKTIVAFLSLITAAANGYQGAIMAPTEVLARQHMEAMRELLKENGLEHIKCGLLTGSMTAKEKRLTKEAIAENKLHIIIGTHAVIQSDVKFAKLGLVVTDEQHRFGVRQRESLANGNDYNNCIKPHVLVMSATPIPRTLAIIVYGDLDISLIDELPALRLPIKNCVVGPNFRPKSYEFILNQINEGRQALVVCPMVEESEQLEAENVIDYTRRLKEMFPPHIRIEYLHGKMKPKEKNEIMERFALGDIHLLVSTTVIEVGINVPNTTVMMVENAERFGLSQLHQLRGRVGRGKHQSYCIFMCKTDSDNAIKRLDILNKTNDGFKIAEEDLKQRGPGDMFGFRQSGDMSFKIGDIFTDAKTLKAASDYADYLYNNGFDDSIPKYNALYERLAAYSHNQTEQVNL